MTTEPNRWRAAFNLKDNFRSIYQRRASNYAAIDGIRAVSILLVLIFHTFFVFHLSHPDHTIFTLLDEFGLGWAWAWNGDKGVDVFFVMSGFLISGILFREQSKNNRIDLKRFYLRRYLRLTPAYYFALTVYWLMNGPHSEWIWANYLYVSNFIHYSHQAMGWTWSLAIEEQFYFIYPLLLIALLKYTKRPGIALVWLFIASFFVRAFVVLNDPEISQSPGSRMYADPEYFDHFFTILYDNLHTRFGSLVIGCLAAYGFHYYKPELDRFANSLTGIFATFLGLFLIVFFMMFPSFSPAYDSNQGWHVAYYIFNRNLFSIGVGIIIIACLLQRHVIADLLRGFFGLRFWYPLATLSYSLYLIHLIVMAAVIPYLINLTLTHPLQYDWSTTTLLIYGFIISTVISLIVATAMYLTLEKPIMNLR